MKDADIASFADDNTLYIVGDNIDQVVSALQNAAVGFSTLYNVDTTSVSDVETTSKQPYTTSKQRCTKLYQRCFNLAWTLVKAILSPIGLVMIMDL